MPFRKWVMVGFAIGVGLLLCAGTAMLLYGLVLGIGQAMKEIANPKPRPTQKSV